MWEHPVDEYYKKMLNFEREKKRNRPGIGTAKEGEKKKKKKKDSKAGKTSGTVKKVSFFLSKV